ncbi:macrophage metalloelastase-like [Diadema antillarum]|uniref:macrophage metalloelastase-like n=1 Tax=Diadema antillarum TaxID=105358 RepID=UPI003A84C236
MIVRNSTKGAERPMVLLLGLLLLPCVIGQFWGNKYGDYANYNDYYPQYQDASAADQSQGQSQGQSQPSYNSNDSDEDFDADDVAYLKNFLKKYEYLANVKGVISQEDEESAIRRLQRMAGLAETGRLNNATLAKIKSKRCGNSDRPVDTSETRRRRFAIQHGWTKRKLTWAIKNFTPDLGRATIRRVMAQSFQVWSDVARLDFSETNFPNADIIILFARESHGDGYAFDGPGGTLAHAYFPGDGIGGDVHFDEDETFSDRTRHGTNLFIVAAHEIGHSLGLAHSEVSGALMAPYYQGYQPKFRLPSDDIRGIQNLYGARARPQPPNRPRPPPGRPNVPDRGPRDRSVCNAPVSAVAHGTLTGTKGPALYIFSGEQFWVKKAGERVSIAMATDSVFIDMQSPPDAAFIRTFRGQQRMVFFSGNEIWEFSRGVYQPMDIRERTGIATNKIEAAFKWARNNKIYLFSGRRYWRINENTMRVDPSYPRPIMANWRGRVGNFDAVWTQGKGRTTEIYFLEKRQVYSFKDNEVYFVSSPRSFASDWLACGANIGSGGSGSGAASQVSLSNLLLVASICAALRHML